MVVYKASEYGDKIVELLRDYWGKFVEKLKEGIIDHIYIVGDCTRKLEDISIGVKVPTGTYYDYALFQITAVRDNGTLFRSIEVSLSVKETVIFLFTNEEWYKYRISEKLWEWVKELLVGNANRLQ